MQNPSSEQQAVTEQLTQLVEEAKEELEEIKEVLTSVPAPTYTDIVSSNTEGIDSSIGILSDEATDQLFYDILESSLYFQVLFSVFLLLLQLVIYFTERSDKFCLIQFLKRSLKLLNF